MKKRRPRLRAGDTVKVLPCVTGYRSRYAGKTGEVVKAGRPWWNKGVGNNRLYVWIINVRRGRWFTPVGFKRHELKLVKRGKA